MRYQTKFYVDLNILRENISKIKNICPKNKIIFMVKGDAYGHGMIPVTRFVCEELKIREFGCASLGEAKKLRDELSDLDFEVFVFSDTNLEFQSCAEMYLENKITPVISNLNDLNHFLSDYDFVNFPLTLKFDTGMNRLGLSTLDIDKVIALLQKFGRKKIFHLFSHFGEATTKIECGSPAYCQYEKFLDIKKKLSDSGIEIENSSIANSAAVEQGFALEESHVRPGLISYGHSSLDAEQRGNSLWSGRSISRLETYIISAFEVDSDTPVGYSGIKAGSPGVVALIALGYADGFTNRLSAPEIKYKNFKGTFLGRSNMDMSRIFFKGVTKKDIQIGDRVLIWDHDNNSLMKLSDTMDSIPYEITSTITPRVPRIYKLD